MGTIFFIAPQEESQLDEMAQWTLQWVLENRIPVDTFIHSCSSLEQARRAIQKKMAIGDPPALIVFDHLGSPTPEAMRFGAEIRSGIPEAWTVELVPANMPLPAPEDDSFWLRRPVKKDDWIEVLNHVCRRAASPQWSLSE
ncbi:MAG: hypothetical protein LBR60_02125 [Fibrobacter sp.]|nr:hypothetical protein [Fibrobacter sp.]